MAKTNAGADIGGLISLLEQGAISKDALLSAMNRIQLSKSPQTPTLVLPQATAPRDPVSEDEFQLVEGFRIRGIV